MSLRYISTRADERLAPRYISRRRAQPPSAQVMISRTYVSASATAIHHASASAIRSAHTPRTRASRRPNQLMLSIQHISMPTTPTKHRFPGAHLQRCISDESHAPHSNRLAHISSHLVRLHSSPDHLARGSNNRAMQDTRMASG